MARKRHWSFWPIVGFVALLFALFLACGYLFGSAHGASVVLRAAGLKAEGLEGRLLGPLRADRIQFDRPQLRVVVDKVAFDWTPWGLLAKRFHVTDLVAQSITIATAPSNEPAKLPVTLEPPLGITVDKADVKSVRFGTLPKGELTPDWTPDFEANEIALKSVAGGDAWVIDQLGAVTKAGRVDVKGKVGARKPFPLDLTASLAGQRDGKTYRLEGTAQGELAKFEAIVRGGEGGITGEARATIQPYERQPVRRVAGKLDGIDINAFAPAAPRTLITANVDLTATSDNALEGPAAFTNTQAGRIDEEKLPVRELKGRLRIAPPRYDVRDAVVAFAGNGSATGEIHIEGTQTQADLKVTGVDLAAIHGKLRPTQLAGRIEAKANAEAQRFVLDLSDPRFQIAGRAGIEKKLLTVEEVRIARGPSSAKAAGTLQLDGAQAFDFAGTLDHLDPALFANVPAGELSGKLHAKGTLSPAVAGEVTVDGLDGRLAGLAIGGRAVVSGDMKRIARADVALVLANAKLDAKGAFGRTGDTMDVKLTATDLAPIGRAFDTDLAGSIDLDGKLTGTFAAPGGNLKLRADKLRLPGGVGAETLVSRIDASSESGGKVDGSMDVANLTRATKDGVETVAKVATLTVAGTRAQHRVQLRATLPVELAPLAAPNDPKREPRVNLVLAGGLVDKAAKPTWSGRIETATMTGANAMALVSPATLLLSKDKVELGEAQFKGDLGETRFLVTRWSPQLIEVRGSSEGLITRPIVRSLGLAMSPRSTLVLGAQWDVKAGDTLDGFVRVKRLQGDLRVGDPPVALGLETLEASLEATRGQVRASVALDGKQIGKVDAKATTTIRKVGDAWKFPSDAPLAGNVDADLPTLKWASDWAGPEAKLEGQVKGQVALGGTLGTPTWKGRLTAENIEVRDTTFGFDVDKGNAAVTFDQKRLAIERFELASAWRPSDGAKRRFGTELTRTKGTITADGAIDLDQYSGTITVKAQGYPVSQLSTRFIAGSGEAKITAADHDLSITGTFNADAGWLGISDSAPPSLSDDVLVDRGANAPQPASDKQRLSLDVRLGLGEHLYFSGRGLFTRLAGDVRVRGEPGKNLAATGSIRTDGGTYDAYGQKLVIERGVLNFQGTLENPGLNILATRAQDLPVTAGVEILGSVSRPDVRLYSRPDVPDHEKLSWLVLGRGPADANEKDTATLAAAAGALLGATAGNRRILRNFGFDDIGISRASTGNLGTMPKSTIAGRTSSTSGSEVFTVGKRLTQDIYVSYQQGLADAQASLRFTYQVTQKLQLLLRAGDRPGVDGVYRFTFGGDDKKK